MIWGGFVVGYFGGGGEYPSFIVRLSFVIRSFRVGGCEEVVGGCVLGGVYEGVYWGVGVVLVLTY
ncbi:hypothetical protein C4H12_10675 [Capnocytophaga sp. oral taxon 878]|nr:hypothetical protein C4H12_10675 [Capnocytophaga sp. oral taxon 878]